MVKCSAPLSPLREHCSLDFVRLNWQYVFWWISYVMSAVWTGKLCTRATLCAPLIIGHFGSNFWNFSFSSFKLSTRLFVSSIEYCAMSFKLFIWLVMQIVFIVINEFVLRSRRAVVFNLLSLADLLDSSQRQGDASYLQTWSHFTGINNILKNPRLSLKK